MRGKKAFIKGKKRNVVKRNPLARPDVKKPLAASAGSQKDTIPMDTKAALAAVLKLAKASPEAKKDENQIAIELVETHTKSLSVEGAEGPAPAKPAAKPA